MVEHTLAHELEAEDVRALLEDRRRRRRHRPGQDAADVRVVPARRGEEDDLLRLRIEYRRDDRDVRQVPARMRGAFRQGKRER